MKLSELIKNYRKEHHISARSFAKLAGFSNAYISLLENDKVNSPSIDALNSIANAMGLSLDAMLRSVDDMNVRLSKEASGYQSVKNIFPVPEMHKVPLIGTIACGEPIYADQEYGYIETSVKADFCLRAQGDSMTGARIRNGDIVYCLAQPEVQNGEIAAVIIDDEATLKRFYFYGDTIVLHPENPDFQDLVYRGEEMAAVRILGKAIEFRGKVR